MKQLGSALAVAALVVGSSSLAAHAQAPNIEKGGYLANYVTAVYITGVTQVTGSSCSFSEDEDYIAILRIADGGQTVTLVSTNPHDSSDVPISYFLFLPALPAGLSVGASTNWTGNYERLLLPGGTESEALPFSGTIEPTTDQTFVGTMTFSDLPAANSSSCDVSLNYSSNLGAVVVSPLGSP